MCEHAEETFYKTLSTQKIFPIFQYYQHHAVKLVMDQWKDGVFPSDKWVSKIFKI